MFKNSYAIVYFFCRYVFTKNLVDSGFAKRELWLKLVGVFQQCLFVLAYRSSHLSCLPTLCGDRQCCLCLSSQGPFSFTEALPQPPPWPAVAAFPLIIQSPMSPLHAIFCCLALLKASMQLAPSLSACNPYIHFRCSETQFPPLILCSSAVPWPSAPPQLEVVSNAAYTSSVNIFLSSKCSVISSGQLSLLTVLQGPPVSSYVLQVHAVSS